MTSKLPLLRCPRCKRMDLFDIGDGRTMLCNYCEWSGDVSLMIAEKQEPSQCEKDFKEEIEFQKWFQGKQEPQWCEHTIDMSKYIPVSKIEEKIKELRITSWGEGDRDKVIDEFESLLPKK